MHIAAPETPHASPPVPPPPADMAVELAAVQAKRKAAAERLAAVGEQKKAAADDPAAKLAAEKLALAREERAVALAAHELTCDTIYRDASLERGEDMVARIRTDEGSIILRGESEPEFDKRIDEMNAHLRHAAQATGTLKASHEHNAEESTRMAVAKLVLSDAAHFKRTMARYHALWGTLTRILAEMATGRAVVLGKGVAP